MKQQFAKAISAIKTVVVEMQHFFPFEKHEIRKEELIEFLRNPQALSHQTICLGCKYPVELTKKSNSQPLASKLNQVIFEAETKKLILTTVFRDGQVQEHKVAAQGVSGIKISNF